MAVIVTDRRITINEADVITGWNQGSAVTTFFAEAPACIAVGNNAPEQIYFTTTARNATSTLIYVYAFNNGLQNPWTNAANPPVGLLIGDGTNRVSFNMAGDDKKVFVHSDGPTAWQNLVLDTDVISTMNTNGYTTVRAGTFAGLNVAALTQFGVDQESLSKALGGGFNMACDIIRIGNDGIRITGGGIGTEGKFIEIAIEDRSTADGKAHGLIRELISGVFGCQGPLTFGDSANATDSRFSDSGIILAYESRDVANDKYYFNVEGNAGATNQFILTNSTITTAGPFVRCDFSGGNVNTLTLSNNTFSSLANSITFSSAIDSVGHTISGNVFNAVGQIDIGLVVFTNNTISNSTDATGALLINNASRLLLSDNTINSGGTGHGLLLGTLTATDITLDAIIFNGYGTNDTTNAAIYNNSGKAITINITGGGTNPTVRNGTGATTTIVNAVNVTVSGLREFTEVRVYPAGQAGADELAGIEDAIAGTFDDRSYTFSLSAGVEIDIQIVSLTYEIERIEGYVVPNVDANIPIQQRFDRNYIPTI
jgi:hypothetical protein